MKIEIFGGKDEIGGNKILLEHKDTRIFLDFGMSFKQAGMYFSEFLQPRKCAALTDFFELGLLPDFEGFAGQTLGKSFFRLKVVCVDGKKLYYDSAAVRNFGKCFLLPIDLLIGLRLKDDRFIKFFDKFSGTTVIRL